MTTIESAILHPDLPVFSSVVETFVTFLCNKLSVFPRKITVAPYELDDGILGVCIDETKEDFILLVKQNERNLTEVFVTIAHEMVHVKQHIKENLGWFLDNHSHIPYHERWWELEANKKSVSLVEQFVDLLKRNTNSG